MEYRALGRTGLSASVIGLGTEHLDNKPYEVVEETVHSALDHGVNIMDLFMPGDEVRRNIGKAIAGRRDKVMIQGHIGSVDLDRQYDISRDPAICRRYFENLLRALGTDYIDFGMLFFIDDLDAYKAMFESDIFAYAQDLKKQGVIRRIGASCHNPTTGKLMVENGVVDMLMFSVNPVFDMLPPDADFTQVLEGDKPALPGLDPRRLELYRLCEQRGVGITVMKTLLAGKLVSKEQTPFAQPLTVGQCIHYALTRPAVASVLVGCQSRAQVEAAVGYLSLSEAERDYAPIVGAHQGKLNGGCVYCNHCQPCPSEIDIAAANKALDIARLDEARIPDEIRRQYGALKRHGGDCVACGHCEERCPFGVPVMEKMKDAVRLFGN